MAPSRLGLLTLLPPFSTLFQVSGYDDFKWVPLPDYNPSIRIPLDKRAAFVVQGEFLTIEILNKHLEEPPPNSLNATELVRLLESKSPSLVKHLLHPSPIVTHPEWDAVKHCYEE